MKTSDIVQRTPAQQPERITQVGWIEPRATQPDLGEILTHHDGVEATDFSGRRGIPNH